MGCFDYSSAVQQASTSPAKAHSKCFVPVDFIVNCFHFIHLPAGDFMLTFHRLASRPLNHFSAIAFQSASASQSWIC